MSKKAIMKRGGKTGTEMVPQGSEGIWQPTVNASTTMMETSEKFLLLANFAKKLETALGKCDSAMEEFAKSLPGCAVQRNGGDAAPKESTTDTKKADSTDAKKADAPAPVSGDPVEVIPGVPLDGLVKVGYFYVKYKNGRPVGIASSEEISEIKS